MATHDRRVRARGSLTRHALARLGILAAVSLGATHAQAQALATRPWLLGDWGGERTRLAERGIDFNVGYGTELAHNVSGGTRHLTRYTDQWTFGTTLDLDKGWGWHGGTFQFTMTDRNGKDLGADAGIGNSQLIQEVWGRGQTWHLTQLWLDQKLLDDRLQIKFGRLTMGEDFFSFSCFFQNLSFCGAQPGNLVGDYWVNWPTSRWGVRLKYHPTADSYVQFGAYQVSPKYVDDRYQRRNGWAPNIPGGTTGALMPLEAGWQPHWHGLPGTYMAGLWYNTSDGDDLYLDVNRNPRGLTGLDALQRKGQYGGYFSLQQQVSGVADGRGATLFLNFTQADRKTARLDRQLTLGLLLREPIEGRVKDTVGVAIGATHSNPRFADAVAQDNGRTGQEVVAGRSYEYVGEVYYSWVPATSIYLRPNLQYILHPGGTTRNSNAFIIGLKASLTF